MKNINETILNALVINEARNYYLDCFTQTNKLIRKFKNKLSDDEIRGAMESAIKEYFD